MKRTHALLASASFIVLLATGCEYVEVDGVGTRTYDAEFVPQDDITEFVGCARMPANQWQVDGQVTNHTPDRASYSVTIAFNNGTTRLEERTLWIRDLAPGQVGEMNRGWWLNNPDSVTDCEVLTIDRHTTTIVDPADASSPDK